MDYRQLKEYNEFYRKKGWVVDNLSGNFILIKRFPILGSIIKIKRCSRSLDLSGLEKMIFSYNAFLVKIEYDLAINDSDYPTILANLQKFGYLPSRFVFSPTKTSIIDLSPDLDVVVSNFDRDVRRNLRQKADKNIQFINTSIDDFYPLLKDSALKHRFAIDNTSDWFNFWREQEKWITTTIGYVNGEIGGGTMVLAEGETAFGIFFALNDLGREAKLSYSLMFEAFKTAKEKGSQFFDLEGIYDARYGKPKEWIGLTAFKNKFKGREVEFIPAMAKSSNILVRQLIKFGLI